MTQQEIDQKLAEDQSWIPQNLRDIGLINSDGTFRSPPPGPLLIDLAKDKYYQEYQTAKQRRISELTGVLYTPEEDISEDFEEYLEQVNKLYVRKENGKMNKEDIDDMMMPWDIQDEEESPPEEPTVSQVAETQKAAMAALMNKYEAPPEEEKKVEEPDENPFEDVETQEQPKKEISATEEKVVEPEEKPAEEISQPKKKASPKKKTKSEEKSADISAPHHTPEEAEEIVENMILNRTHKEFRARQAEINDILSKLILTTDMTPQLLSARLTDIANLIIDISEERNRINTIVKGLFDKEGQIYKAAYLNREGSNEVERKQSEVKFLQNFPSADGREINIIEIKEYLELQQVYYNGVFEELKALQMAANSMVSLLRTEASV